MADPLTQQSVSGALTPDFSKAYIALGKDGKPYVRDPQALWKEVQDLRDDALSARKPHERLWALCWMFFKGDQWRKPAPAPDWNIVRINVGKRPKITVNKILPMVATRRAHVLKNRPTGIVMPASTTEEDRNAARVAQDILNYDQDHLGNWKILDGKLSLTMFVAGNAFKKIYWDPTKGQKKERNRYKTDPTTGAPQMEPDMEAMAAQALRGEELPAPNYVPQGVEGPSSEMSHQPTEQPDDVPTEIPQKPVIEGTEEEPEGDIAIEFVPPEEILPEPAATCLEDCQRLLHRTLKTLKWVKDTYGDAAEKVEPINLRTERGKSLAQGAKLFGLNEREVANRVEVLEAWYRPSSDFPDGLHAVWADDKLMAAGPTPDAHENIPFIHYQEIETDEFWGLSSVSQVIDIQKALNLAVSRDEYMRQRLRPKLMAPTDAGIDESQYSNDDAEIVYYHHPFKPSFTEPPQFQRDEKAVEFFKLAVDDIGGSADIMRGQVSGSDIRSGRMVNYLQEYAGTVLSGPSRSIEEGEEQTGNMILRLRKHYTDEERLYYVVGRDRDVEVKTFIGSDIEGAADYRVQTGSALPASIAEKRDIVFTAVEKGILPPGDPRLLKLLGMPSDLDDIMNEDQLDRDRATEENNQFLSLKEEMIGQAYQIIADKFAMQAGGPDQAAQIGLKPSPNMIMEGLDLQPRDFENHQVHIITHNKMRKSKAYRMLPKSVQAIFDEHVDQHAMYLLPPPMAPGAEGGGEGGGPRGPNDAGPPGEKPGSPSALQGKQPPGPGGAGGHNPEGNQERSGGMPPSRRPPMNNADHMRNT